MESTYTVKYRKINSFFWTTVKNVKGDFVAQDLTGTPRVLILEDDSRIEIPVDSMMFKFSKERAILLENLSREAK